jgi:hypothetical protein
MYLRQVLRVPVLCVLLVLLLLPVSALLSSPAAPNTGSLFVSPLLVIANNPISQSGEVNLLLLLLLQHPTQALPVCAEPVCEPPASRCQHVDLTVHNDLTAR